jgi:hypothetical protein
VAEHLRAILAKRSGPSGTFAIKKLAWARSGGAWQACRKMCDFARWARISPGKARPIAMKFAVLTGFPVAV